MDSTSPPCKVGVVHIRVVQKSVKWMVWKALLKYRTKFFCTKFFPWTCLRYPTKLGGSKERPDSAPPSPCKGGMEVCEVDGSDGVTQTSHEMYVKGVLTRFNVPWTV